MNFCSHQKIKSMRGLKLKTVTLATAVLALAGAPYAQAGSSWLTLSSGLPGWTTQGTVTTSTTSISLALGPNPFVLTPASGETMAEISPQGAAAGSVDALLGLSANSIENLLNNSNGKVTNFGVLTKTFSLNPGTYSFAWAYAAQDYQPYNDGVLFSLSGNGTQSIQSLARNGSSATDKSGPQPGTLILGSYGSTPWETTSFNIATAGSYQLSFASYNWNDTAVDPLFFVASSAGTFTGTPVSTSGGTPAVTVIGTTGGDVSSTVFGTSSNAYGQSSLTFAGGTLQYGANTTTSKAATLQSSGGIIDTQGNTVLYSGVISGSGALSKTGSGVLLLSANNTFTGATIVSAGTLSLTGSGGIADSAVLNDNAVFDISSGTAGTSVQSLSGDGTVNLGANYLALTNAADTFSGAIDGTGGLTITGGTETLSGPNAYSGPTSIVKGATLALNGTGSIAYSTVENSGTFDISARTGDTGVQGLAGAGTVNLGANYLALTNAADTFSGAIDGTGGLTITVGTETLSGSSAYSGSTSIVRGATLALSGTGSIANSLVGDSGTFDISASTGGTGVQGLTGDGTVNLGANTLTLTNASNTFSGAIDGTGGLTITGGTEALSGSSAYSGQTSIAQGADLALSGTGSISNSAVADSGTFDISASSGGTGVQSLSGNGAVVLGANNLTLTNASDVFSGTISGNGGLAITGGTETLTGQNTYSGGTYLENGGTLSIANDQALGSNSSPIVFADGILDNSDSLSLSQSISMGGSGVLQTAPGTTLTAAGAVSGTGSLIKTGTGTLVLSGNNQSWDKAGSTTVGGLTVNAGSVIAASANALGNGTVTLNSGELQTTATMSLAQPVSVAGGTSINTAADTMTTLADVSSSKGTGSCFVKSGAGTLALGGTATLAEGTCVEQGQLYANGQLTSTVSVSAGATLRGIGLITGPVSVAGTLAPGHSPGTLTVAGTVTMAKGSSYEEDINGLGTGTGPGNYSQLHLSGASSQFVATGAVLAPNLVNIAPSYGYTYTPFVPSLGDSFRIVTAQGGIVGRFASVTEPKGLASGTQFAVFYDIAGDNSIDLRVVPTSYTDYFKTSGMRGNTVSTGTAIDTLSALNSNGTATAQQDALFYDLAGLSASKLAKVAPALSGEVHADLSAVAPIEGEWLAGAVMRELAMPQASVGKIRKNPGNALWFDSGVSHGHWHADQNSGGFSSNSVEFAAGIDLLATRSARAGLGFSHAVSTVDTVSGSGSIRQNMLFVYGQKSFHGALVDALAGYGLSHWNTLRADPLGLTGPLNTHVRGKTLLASLGVSLPKRLKYLTVAPYARVLWEKMSRNAFNEATYATPALDALSGPVYSTDGVRVTLGMSLGSVQQNPLATRMTYEFDLGVARDSSAFSDPNVQMALAGEGFRVSTPNIGKVVALARLGTTLRLSSKVFTYLDVAGAGRSGTSANYGGDLGLRALF